MQSNFLIFLFCFLFSVFLFFLSNAKVDSETSLSVCHKEGAPPLPLPQCQCPSQAAVADSSWELCVCVCVPLNQSNSSSSNNNSSSSGSNSTGSVNWPPFANATQRVKCNREQRQENGKQKNKQTIQLMKRSTNREMTNILLQVHALQLMRINVN